MSQSQIETDLLQEVIARLELMIDETDCEIMTVEKQIGIKWAIEEIEMMLQEMEDFKCEKQNMTQ